MGNVITRRDFINKATFATTAASLALSARGATHESLLAQEASADTFEFSKEELARMFNNRQFPPRPEAPCPLPKSSAIKNIRYTYRHRAYHSVVGADTWLTSWAADGNLYSSYADGQVHGVGVGCTINGVDDWYYPAPHIGFYAVPDKAGNWGNANRPPKFLNIKKNPTRHITQGNAIVIGDDPFDLRFQALTPAKLTLSRFPCCYPTGCLVKDGNWFYVGRYCGHFVDKKGNQQMWVHGPNRFRVSRDMGKTWEWSPFDEYAPVIPEQGVLVGDAPVKFGSVHFVDFGKNMEHSPDGYAYLVGHGTCDPGGVSNWAGGDAVFLGRVMPTPDAINSKSAYEWFAGRKNDGTPTWSRTFSDIRPLFEWASRAGLTYITYFPTINKYIALVCAGWPNGAGSYRDTWIAEADALWGPWSFVTYWDTFGWFAQIPSKFIQADGRFVIFTSGGWSGPKPIPKEYRKSPTPIDCPSSEYTLCVDEFQLEL